MRSFPRMVLVAAIIALLNVTIWVAMNRGVALTSWRGGIMQGLSVSGWQAGYKEDRPSDEQLQRDMNLLKGRTYAIRTYSVNDGLERLAVVAGEHGLDVILGAWIGRDKAANEAELNKVLEVIRENRNVRRVIIGNESLLRADVSVAEIIDYIRRIRAKSAVPVSVAEPWHIWLDHPELVAAVDFITVHILPYWEGIPIDQALPYVRYRYEQLQRAYPSSHIMIGEVGWPSDGQWIKGSEPSLINQAKFIRGFLDYATREKIDYSIIEAFDEPWKHRIEGTVGAHWGIWDINRKPKFSMSGKVFESHYWIPACLISTILAMPFVMFFAWRRRNIRLGGKIFYGLIIQVVASLVVWTIMAALVEQIITATTLTWGILVGAQIVLLALLLVDGFELTEVIWANRKRDFSPWKGSMPQVLPKVSIHVPCYNEPPDMVIQTLDALAALDWPDFEVIVVDNNTKDEAVWKPLEEHCAKLGSRFRFFHLPSWPGFKAGALNFALSQSDPDASIIGVIDSDYIVSSDWLTSTIPWFENQKVGFVQAPQDYRDGGDSLFKRLCYWEYAGFFHIGMVQRNERNAIIQHGTMTLIRKDVLRNVGGWAEWCICEDAELGLRMFENGYEAVYMPYSFGRGLIPDSFSGYKSQRFRWAYGAVQIMKRHFRDLRQAGRLTAGQRYHFVSGWLPWFADAAHMLFVAAALVWSVLLGFKLVEFPPAIFLVPTLSVFVFKVLAGLWLYHARVKCGMFDRLGAAMAGMALTHAVGRAVWQGIMTSNKPFFRTPKCKDEPAFVQGFLMAREETILLIALMAAAFAILNIFTTENFDAKLWASMLAVQTLPYWAALCMAMINGLSGSRALPKSIPHAPASTQSVQAA